MKLRTILTTTLALSTALVFTACDVKQKAIDAAKAEAEAAKAKAEASMKEALEKAKAEASKAKAATTKAAVEARSAVKDAAASAKSEGTEASAELKAKIEAARAKAGQGADAIKDVLNAQSEKSRLAMEGMKARIAEFGNGRLAGMVGMMQSGLEKLKSGSSPEQADQIKAQAQMMLSRAKSMVDSLPTDKQESVKAKLAELETALKEAGVDTSPVAVPPVPPPPTPGAPPIPGLEPK